MSFRDLVMSLFAGSARHHPTHSAAIDALLVELGQSNRRIQTFARALVDPKQKPPSTYGRQCDFYDGCPFRSSAVQHRAHIRRLNGHLSGPKDSP